MLIHYQKKETTFIFQLQLEFKIFTLKLTFEEITWIMYCISIFLTLPYSFLTVPFTVKQCSYHCYHKRRLKCKLPEEGLCCLCISNIYKGACYVVSTLKRNCLMSTCYSGVGRNEKNGVNKNFQLSTSESYK